MKTKPKSKIEETPAQVLQREAKKARAEELVQEKKAVATRLKEQKAERVAVRKAIVVELKSASSIVEALANLKKNHGFTRSTHWYASEVRMKRIPSLLSFIKKPKGKVKPEKSRGEEELDRDSDGLM